MEIFKDTAKYLSMIPLVGKLVGKEKGYKSVSDWKGSFGKTEYKPKDLRNLPMDQFAADEPLLLDPWGSPHWGDYSKALRLGRDPEEALELPRGEEGIYMGSKAKSAGQVGIRRHPFEARAHDTFKGPLFKYLPKKEQNNIRRNLEQYEAPIIELAPYDLSRRPEMKRDNSKIWDKPKRQVERELRTILTNKRSI